MFDFIKKMIAAINGESLESELMSRATNMAIGGSYHFTSFLESVTGSDYDFDDKIDALHHEEFHHQMDDFMRQDEIDRMQRDMHDPYVNPGQDIVVDESYHGIDHGSGFNDY